MKKQLLWLFILSALITTQCGKKVNQPALDDAAIKSYLDQHQLTATKTSSGLYYLITSPTNNAQAANGKKAYVNYTGRFLDDKVFDSNNGAAPFSFTIGIGEVIAGWDEGIALLKKGEKARLFIPSAAAYGAGGSGSIPANTPLQFEVELADLK
jgi:FKBP-type peptidyl-prolyl cis-trans isomerase